MSEQSQDPGPTASGGDDEVPAVARIGDRFELLRKYLENIEDATDNYNQLKMIARQERNDLRASVNVENITLAQARLLDTQFSSSDEDDEGGDDSASVRGSPAADGVGAANRGADPREDSAADAQIDDAVLTQAMASDVTEEYLDMNGDPHHMARVRVAEKQRDEKIQALVRGYSDRLREMLEAQQDQSQ